MSSIKLTHSMKRHAVIFALKAQNNDTEIACFLKATRSFVIKVRKVVEAANEDPVSTTKCKL